MANGRMYLIAGSNSATKDLYIYDGIAWAYPVFGITSIESFIDTPVPPGFYTAVSLKAVLW